MSIDWSFVNESRFALSPRLRYELAACCKAADAIAGGSSMVAFFYNVSNSFKNC